MKMQQSPGTLHQPGCGVQGMIEAAKLEHLSAAEVRQAAQVAMQKAAQVKEAEIWARKQKAEQARLEMEAAGRQNAARLERLKQVQCLDVDKI